MTLSTTVEIILYYLTDIFNNLVSNIYNSRNYSILLNPKGKIDIPISTTVEIILYYLTIVTVPRVRKSTTVEIILYYLTFSIYFQPYSSTTVEIILYYLTFYLLTFRVHLQQ